MPVTISPDIHKTFLSNQAKEFRTTYRIKNSTARVAQTKQKDLIVEEFREFIEADGEMWRDSKEISESVLKELADLVYVCYQYADNMDWDLDEALDRVHKSNMSKLDEDGNPIYRKDGKVLKGPKYAPPNLKDLIE